MLRDYILISNDSYKFRKYVDGLVSLLVNPRIYFLP